MREKLEKIDSDYVLECDVGTLGNVFVMDRAVFHQIRNYKDSRGVFLIDHTVEGGTRLLGLKIVFVQHECLMKGVL